MIKIVKELAIAKHEGILYDDVYSTPFSKLVFKVGGEQMQLRLSFDEYDAYKALVKIYNCRAERDLF